MKLNILVLIFLTSCSTLQKSKNYGAITGATICSILGVSIGEEASPNQESDKFNKMTGGLIGFLICGIGGYLAGASFFESDPRNFESEPIDFNKKVIETKQELLNADITSD